MLKERAGRGKLNMLGKMRAMEHQMEHPQLMDDNSIESTAEMRGSGGGDAGMKRVIGGAKKRGRPKKMTGGAIIGGAMSLNDHISGEGKCGMSGGAMSLNDHISGEGKTMTGGAKMGRELGEQIVKLHGEGFFSDFLGGLSSVLKPIASVASFIPGPIGTAGRIASGVMGALGQGKVRGKGRISSAPSGVQVGHSYMSPAQAGLPGMGLGGQDVPPNGVAPIAYGNAPQAPSSFARNTVGGAKALLGRPGHGRMGDVKMEGEGFLSDLGIPIVSNIAGIFGLGNGKCGSCGYKKCRCAGGAVMKKAVAPKASMAVAGGGKRSARGQAISKLMKEKGMSLPQASKYLKENGGA